MIPSMRRMQWILLVALLLGLAGCGGGGQGSTAGGGQGWSGSSGFAWGDARVTDPTRIVSATDDDGSVILAAPGQLLVTVHEEATDEQLEALVEQAGRWGGQLVGAVPGALLLEFQFDPDADLVTIDQLLTSLPGVEVVCRNEVAEISSGPSEATRARALSATLPTFDGSYWMAQIGLQNAWRQLSATAAWPGLGIVDGGTKDLSALFATSRLELVDGQGSPFTTGLGPSDHLSRVVSLAAADGSTSAWGVAWGSRVHAVDVETPALPESDTVQKKTLVVYSRIVWAMDRLLRKGCRVINMSLGPPITSDTMTDSEYYTAAQHFRRNILGAVKEARRLDALICISSGNESKKRDDRWLPGNESVEAFQSNVLLVASNGPGDPRGAPGGYPSVVADANEGNVVSITAPGEMVSTGRAFAPDSGTSYSSPVVAGAALAVMQAAPRLKAFEVRRLLLDTASPNVRSGSGLRLLDLNAAVTRARGR